MNLRRRFATLLLTGLREQELCFLTWRDLDFGSGCLRVSNEEKVGFSPKDYEERVIEMPPDLVTVLSSPPHRSSWVFPRKKRNRLNHLLRRLKVIAASRCRFCHVAQISAHSSKKERIS